MTSSASTRPSAIATGRKPIRPGKRPSPRRASASMEKSGRKGMRASAARELELHSPHDGFVAHALVESFRGCVELVHVELDRRHAVRASESMHVFEQKAAHPARLTARRNHEKIHVEPRSPPAPSSSEVLQLESHAADRTARRIRDQQARSVGARELLAELSLVLRRQRLELVGMLIEMRVVYFAVKRKQRVAIFPRRRSHAYAFGRIDADRLHGQAATDAPRPMSAPIPAPRATLRDWSRRPGPCPDVPRPCRRPERPRGSRGLPP